AGVGRLAVHLPWRKPGRDPGGRTDRDRRGPVAHLWGKRPRSSLSPPSKLRSRPSDEGGGEGNLHRGGAHQSLSGRGVVAAIASTPRSSGVEASKTVAWTSRLPVAGTDSGQPSLPCQQIKMCGAILSS